MPTVPKLDRIAEVPGRLPTPRQSVDAPLEAFGGGQTLQNFQRATQDATSQMFEIARAEKKKADDVATQDAWVRLNQAKTKLFWDPKDGAMTKKGQDAFGVVDTYGAEFDKQADEIEKTLYNDDQKAMFSQMRSRERLEFDGQLQKHTFNEAQTFADETTVSGIATSRNEAVLNYQDPVAIQKSLNMQTSFIMSNAERKGLPPEMAQMQVQEANSKTHSAVLERMLTNGQDLAAQQYFETNKDQFVGEDVVRVEKSLEEGSLRGESQRQSDAIMSKGLGLMGAVNEAKNIEDPKVRDATVERIKSDYALKEQAKRQWEENLMTKSGNIIDKTGTTDSIPPNEWQALSPSQKESLKSYARHKREGTQPETKWSEYYDLKTMASAAPTRDAFLKINMMEYRGQMADAEFKELVSLQTDLRKGSKSAESQLDGYRTDQVIVNDSLRAAGFDPSPKAGKSDLQATSRFRRLVDEQIIVYQNQTGKKADNNQVQNIVDNLMVKVVTDRGYLWNTEKRAFQLGSEDSVEIKFNDIPKAERAKIEQVLRARNIKASEDKIIEIYSKRLKGQAANAN